MPGFYYPGNYSLIRVQLKPHPATPAPAVDDLSVEISRAGNIIALRFCLAGQLSVLRIPNPGSPQRANGLWQHSCFEIFVRQPRGTAYDEYNFSPNRQWQRYHFSDYRLGESQPDTPPPQIAVLQQPDQLSLITSISVPDGPLQVGLSAVLEAADGGLSYWALEHPGEKPDFHHSDAFALNIE